MDTRLYISIGYEGARAWGYDEVLGMDWLEGWGEMTCHWAHKWVRFQYQGKIIQLQGVTDIPYSELQEFSVNTVAKLYRGNEIWATTILEPVIDNPYEEIPAAVQEVLQQYSYVFKETTHLPPH